MEKQVDLGCLVKKWPSAIVSRREVGRFSGGILNPGTLANLDCEGTGPRRFMVKNRVAYFASDLVDWMEKQARRS